MGLLEEIRELKYLAESAQGRLVRMMDVVPRVPWLCDYALALERDNEALKYSLKAAEEVGVALGLDLSNLSVHLEKLEAVRAAADDWLRAYLAYVSPASTNEEVHAQIRKAGDAIDDARTRLVDALAAVEKGEKDAKL